MDEVPSGMTPQERAAFWAEVATANREAWVNRELAKLLADSGIPRWLWALARVVGQAQRRLSPP